MYDLYTYCGYVFEAIPLFILLNSVISGPSEMFFFRDWKSEKILSNPQAINYPFQNLMNSWPVKPL